MRKSTFEEGQKDFSDSLIDKEIPLVDLLFLPGESKVATKSQKKLKIQEKT